MDVSDYIDRVACSACEDESLDCALGLARSLAIYHAIPPSDLTSRTWNVAEKAS